MLSWACRRFRARFAPGAALPHRRACADCNAYAAAVEQAAGVRLPLPASLRRNLKALAGEDAEAGTGTVLPFPVPWLAVPDELARRLRRIAAPARSSPPAPPEWVRSPRAAIAASVLLALLFGPLLAGAADRGQQALELAHQLAHQKVEPLVEDAGAESHRVLGRLWLAAGTAGGSVRESAAKSVRRLQGGLSELSSRSVRLFNAVTDPFTNPDPRRDAGGASRRTR
jgi:hypothetical protein